MARASIRWIVCCLISSALSLAAQSPAADPISGTWTGSMGPNDTDRHPITADLSFDGTTITGRITGPPYPGEITSGSFDATSGTLKLDVIVKDEDSTRVSFEGTLTDGTATGRVQLRDQSGTFTMKKNAAPAAAATASASAARQRGAGVPATQDEMKASYEAHKGDFDYLLGDWAFTAEHKDYGTFGGYWSAVRLDTGQILDEFRIVDEKDETIYVTTTVRAYNGALDRWELIGMNGGNGLQDTGTGQRVGSEVRIEQRFGIAEGKPSTLRIRYYNIQPDRFSWTADRSVDGGKTWTEKYEQIEARRIGASRALGPLAVPKKEAPARRHR
jgi:hypothetical protein